ncbi:MAG TPA: glucosamine-6-phosphate deaminase [Terriglobales bacterium]|nr:glucosamine-6-phosphate deaminase [Terriglobales bacterium]
MTAATVLEEELAQRPRALVVLPTGNTPLPLYAELRRRGGTGAMRVAMLDDYYDADSLATNSYQWLRREVLDPLKIGAERLLRIPTAPDNLPAACAGYEAALERAGGCNLIYLGLGPNGHIGFNEPGSAITSRTRLVTLTDETAAANAEYWKGAYCPRAAVTMGIATILEARRICLLVGGRGKSAALRAALEGPETPDIPASYLRRARGLVVIADRACLQ